MNNLNKFKKLRLRLGLCGIIIIASNLGCVTSPTVPFIQTTTDPTSYFTHTSEVVQTQEITLQPSLTTKPPIKSTLILQPSRTDTIQPTEPSTKPLPTVNLPTDIVWEMLGQVNQDRALNDLKQLTGELSICINNECYTIKNRLTGSEGLRWAKDYVYNELVNLGYSVRFLDWVQSGYSDQNLIARKPGVSSPEEEIYLVAHLDGFQEGSEERFPAADDNASGAVDLLEVAKVLSSYSFSRTVVLFFSTGEEQGALGVQSYVSQLSPGELSSIKYVVDVDMVGYDENHDGVMELWNGDHSPSLTLAQMMSETILVYQLDLKPSIISGCD